MREHVNGSMRVSLSERKAELELTQQRQIEQYHREQLAKMRCEMENRPPRTKKLSGGRR